jgi:hypothetical protein
MSRPSNGTDTSPCQIGGHPVRANIAIAKAPADTQKHLHQDELRILGVRPLECDVICVAQGLLAANEPVQRLSNDVAVPAGDGLRSVT